MTNAVISDSDTASNKSNTDQQLLTGYGLTFQVDGLRDSSEDDKEDHLRRIRGVGLLLKRRSKGPWRCVNLASIQTHMDASSIVVEEAALVPSRIIYQNQLNQATISYNNDPLIARGPLSFATDVQLQPTDVPSPVAQQLLTYFYSNDQGAKLVGLLFGSSYDALPFLVSNSGVLPPLIASASSPIEVSASLPETLSTTYKLFVRSNITYPRFAPVTHPRLFDEFGKQDISFPQIPNSVFPRSREAHQGNQQGSNFPLLLLAPKGPLFKNVQDSFKFTARPPVTDIQTWDRFVNGTSRGTLDRRQQVWCNYYDLEKKNRATQNDLGKPTTAAGIKADVTIDDPATEYDSGSEVKRFFYMRMEDESGTEKCACFLKVPAPNDDGLGIVQAPVVNIQVNIGAGLTITGREGTVNQVSPNTVLSGNIVLSVPDAAISAFELCSCVHKSHTARFSSFQGVPISGTDFYRTSSQRVLVEVADSQIPTSAQLWNAFSVDDGAVMNGVVSLKLEDNPSQFRNVWRAEIMRQVWKWSGRPVLPLLPPAGDASSTEANPPSHSDLSEWEVREFGTRYDFDHLVMPMVRRQPNSFSYTERMQGNGSSNDLKATYLRFGVRAYSRYAGILSSNYSIEARPDADSRGWKSLFIPCRKFVDIKALDIKLILPLTRKASDEQVPGLMVLVRGPWFQEGGLGEFIEAEVEIAPDPRYPVGGKPTTFYYQYGPDPILKSSPATQLVKGTDEVRFGTLTGPIGHTYDVGSDDPLFVNTSFLLSPPTITHNNNAKINEPVANDPWSFCQIRLKRVIHLNQDESKKVESKFTQPFWVQFLPDFSIFGGIDVSNLVLKMIDASHLQFQDDTAAKEISAQGFFSLYVVLTRRVVDATGSEGQEEFVGLYQKANSSTWSLVGPQTVADYMTGEFRARVIEVQAGSGSGPLPTLASADSLWDALFRADQQDSARARITRISAPVDSVSNAALSEELTCRTLAAVNS